jgi:protein O-mannosyl-transferase
VHPVQVEPVAWVSGAKDLFCGLFSIAALLEYVRFVTGKRRKSHYAVATLFLILALLSKPTAMVVPIMAGSIDIILLRHSWRKAGFALLPWFVLMVACAAVARISQPTTLLWPLPAWMSPGIAGDAVAFYLYKLLLPLRMSVDYGRRPQAVLANGWIYYTWLLPTTVFIFLWFNRRRWPVVFTSGLLFLLPLIPVLGFTPFMFQEVSTTADHYLYLAMLGPALFVAWLMDRYRGRIPIAIAATALLLLTLRTITLEPVWQNTRTLFEHALEVNPNSFVACDMLGFDHAREGRLLRDNPTASRAQLQIAAGYYVHALEINPQYVPSLFNLAIVFQELGQDENARRAIQRIAELQPSLPPGLRTDPVIIAEKLIAFGAYPDALRWLDRILLEDPGNMKALKLRAHALAVTRPAEG